MHECFADEIAIGVVNHKTTAVRVIPVPGKQAGERAVFGGLFGEMAIIPIHAAGGSAAPATRLRKVAGVIDLALIGRSQRFFDALGP